MIRRPTRSTLTDTLVPDTTHFRSNKRRKRTHGYAGRTFGSGMRALGTDLPLARGKRRRTRGMNLIQTIEAEEIAKAGKEMPTFRPGDTLRVGVRVVEGERTRVQNLEGVCIARSNKGMGSNRSEESRVGKECVSTWRSRWAQ